MDWHPGHVWRNDIAKLRIDDLSDDFFEYKLIIKECQVPGQILKWQSGENSMVDIKRLNITIKELNLAKEGQGVLSPTVSIDRRTKIKLENNVLVIILNFDS